MAVAGSKANEESKPRARLWPRIVLLVSVLAVCAVFGELATRLLFADKIVLFPRFHTDAPYDGFTLRRLRPGATFAHSSIDGTWKFRVNAQGFRDDHDYAYVKPTGTIRVLALGDSHTQGFEVRQEHTFTEVLERKLRKSGRRAEVLNTGISGFGTAEQLAFLESEGLKYEPDVVLVGFYANDFEDNIKAGLYELEDGALIVKKRKHAPGVRVLNAIHAIPFTGWLSQNSYLYSLGFNTGWNVAKRRLLSSAEVELQTEYTMPQELVTDVKKTLMVKLLKRLHEVCRENGALLVIMDLPRHESYGAFVSSVPDDARSDFVRNSDRFIDSRTVLTRYEGIAELHVPNGQHHLSELSHLLFGLSAAEVVLAASNEAP